MDSVYVDIKYSEKQVARFLRELDLWWVYEFPVFVFDEQKRPRVWAPDFYIPKSGMYIEVCGSKDFDYEYRDKIYRKMGIMLSLFIRKKNGRNRRTIW